MLLRTGGDLHHALYCALADKRAAQSEPGEVEMAHHNPTQGNKINDDMDQLVLKSFNTALHRQAQEWSKRSNQADALAEVNLMNEINCVNVRLWKMIWMLTSPVHGQEMSVNPTPISEATSRSRHLPCLFLLASLAHTTFPQCNFLCIYLSATSWTATVVALISYNSCLALVSAVTETPCNV